MTFLWRTPYRITIASYNNQYKRFHLFEINCIKVQKASRILTINLLYSPVSFILFAFSIMAGEAFRENSVNKYGTGGRKGKNFSNSRVKS